MVLSSSLLAIIIDAAFVCFCFLPHRSTQLPEFPPLPPSLWATLEAGGTGGGSAPSGAAVVVMPDSHRPVDDMLPLRPKRGKHKQEIKGEVSTAGDGAFKPCGGGSGNASMGNEAAAAAAAESKRLLKACPADAALVFAAAGELGMRQEVLDAALKRLHEVLAEQLAEEGEREG